MHCEGCQCNFNVLRRKRGCYKCRRYFCSNCLRTIRKMLICYVCEIFMRRPILREDLRDIKIKDLIFYLQSEHISTAGCVEKEDLISLVLQHIQSDDGKYSSSSSSTNSPNRFAHKTKTLTDRPLEAIKQTCQNFFSNIGDNISQSWVTLEHRSYAKAQNSKATHESCTKQPNTSTGVKTRKIPTYTDSQRRMSAESRHPVNNNVIDTSQLYVNLTDINSNMDDFDCCDDDDNDVEDDGLPACLQPNTSSPNNSNHKDIERLDGLENAKRDSRVRQLSFQELGACGGEDVIEGGNQTIQNSDSNSLDEWQILHLCDNVQLPTAAATTSTTTKENILTQQNEEKQSQLVENTFYHLKANNVRRHSDSYLLLFNKEVFNKMPNEPIQHIGDKVHSTATFCNAGHSAEKSKCFYCSKQSIILQKRAHNIQNRLENVRISETAIKQELQAFFNYLDQHLKFADCSNSRGPSCCIQNTDNKRLAELWSSATVSNNPSNTAKVKQMRTDCIRCDLPTRFINLNEFETPQQFEVLTVKQLKELLMINRIDYKGCCEKHELLDRVIRLWKNLKSTPAVEKLAAVELCKICMDAPIECVILECGHMATCTNCGKVLSECPICRQYIVRVVRFFRA